MTRPSWDDVFMQLAETVATRSVCSRRQCGTVIVNPQNQVVAVSYNGPVPGFERPTDDCADWCPRAITGETPDSYANCVSNHSEANGIIQAGVRAANGTAYVAGGSLCITCAKLLAGARVARVVYRPDPRDDYRFPERTLEFLHASNVEVTAL